LVAPAVDLAVAPAWSVAGTAVVLTATVPADATGIVEFFNGADSLGVATVATGVATLTTTALTPGLASLTAAYAPDLAAGSTYVASESDAVDHAVVATDTVGLAIRGDSPVTVGQPATYTVSMGNGNGTNIVTISITADGDYLNLATVEPLNDFFMLGTATWNNVGANLWKTTVTLMYPGLLPASGSVDILKITGSARELVGQTTVTLSDPALIGNTGSGSGPLLAEVAIPDAVTDIVARVPVYSKWDLNRDGTVDMLDVSVALYFYLMTDADPNWETILYNDRCAKDADVNGDGVVNQADLIEIMANFGPYNIYP
jgi:hypothetical protein